MTQFEDVANSEGLSFRRAALVAGIGLLLMAILAPIANFGLIQELAVAGDSARTARNIAASDWTFRVGIAGLLLVAVLDVIVAWSLYVLLEPANRSLSLLAALFRLVYAGMFATALNELVGVSRLVRAAGVGTTWDAAQRNAEVTFHLDAFRSGWDLALVVFGFHLVVLGALAFRSGYVPRYLGVLLAVSGLGYVADGGGKILFPTCGISVSAFTFVGEVVLIFWLLWKGIRRRERQPARIEGLSDEAGARRT